MAKQLFCVEQIGFDRYAILTNETVGKETEEKLAYCVKWVNNDWILCDFPARVISAFLDQYIELRDRGYFII